MCAERSVVLCANKDAFKCRVLSYTLKNNNYTDLAEFFNAAFPLFASETEKILNRLLTVKINTCFEAKFTKPVTKSKDIAEKSADRNDADKNIDIGESVTNRDGGWWC